MVVFLMGAVMLLLWLRVLKDERYAVSPWRWGTQVILSCAAALVLRTVIVKLLTAVFGLQEQYGVLQEKGLAYVLGSVKGWFDGNRDFDVFLSVLKEFLVKYYLHAAVYLPVFLLVLAILALALWTVFRAARGRDVWVAACGLGIILLPWVMPVLEGMPTYYRASQYVPLLTAFVMLPADLELHRSGNRKKLGGVAVLAAGILLYAQCYEMNRWLLVDAMKYEDDKRTLDALALELEAEHDAGKPLCVIGDRRPPVSLLKDVYTPTWSKKYTLVSLLVKAVDADIFEKYDTSYGYAAPETPQLSFIGWADKAFFGYDRELIKFWKMHGFTFVEDSDPEHYVRAKEMMRGGPAWPEKGSIVELDDYIVVNFGE